MPEAIFDYMISGRLMAPAGSKLNPTGSGVILPDGREIKLWEQLEINTPGEDDHENMDLNEAADLGIFYDGDCCEFDAVDLGAETQLWPPK
jgi:hypothetical protein